MYIAPLKTECFDNQAKAGNPGNIIAEKNKTRTQNVITQMKL